MSEHPESRPESGPSGGDRRQAEAGTAPGLRWLYGELPSLVEARVLDDATAQRLRQHYGELQPARSSQRVLLGLFGLLGTLLIGGGIILLLAYNWEGTSRPVRTVLSVLPLLLAQGLAAWLLFFRKESTESRGAKGPIPPIRTSVAWREGVAVLWTLAIGASIALVSQTYHIPGDLGDFLLVWSLLSLPVAYLLGASPLLYGVGIAVWYASGWAGEASKVLAIPLLGLAGPLLFLLYRRNRRHPAFALMSWVYTGVFLIVLMSAFQQMVPFVPLAGYAAVLALFVLLDDLWFRGESLWRRPLLWTGLLGTAGFALAMTFGEAWSSIWDNPGGDPSVPVLVLRWTLFGLLLGAFAWAFWTQSKRRREQAMAPRWHLVWALFPIVIALGGVLPAMGRGFDLGSVVLLNGYLLAVGLLTLLDGIRISSLAVTNLGMATLLVLLVARFFDWEIGFVARGLLFIALGSGFLLFNVLWMRRNKEALP